MALTKIILPSVLPSYQGKVRDLYDLGESIIMVASDRLSAFDVIFEQGIPHKGEILTAISNSWFQWLTNVKNHLISTEVKDFPAPFSDFDSQLNGRAVWVKKTKRIDFECVVRNYLMGSAWAEYKKLGTVNGEQLPPGLEAGCRLQTPIFTPATKADEGHDINVPFSAMQNSLGKELAESIRKASIELFERVSQQLATQNILLLDTKLEFGLLDNELILIDEIFTPDSSRFCQISEWENAIEKKIPVPTMDKQIIRDYLEKIQWDKSPPPPALPDDIIERTRQKYVQIQEIVKCITE
ncbi:MAG: phosphoribosylaminoimidazolesuccinocarboxamide synthase [Leptospiraceae bacterium]|nr:phosphoribosylaminoimidazolesuccinocarboxamide synthase [Leptospiraceae bacterium]